MWVRGLKQETYHRSSSTVQSHPMWVRGLKPTPRDFMLPKVVAPYVGAWIETNQRKHDDIEEIVAPYVGAWIETIHNSESWQQK